jgi:hypothetical protein
MSSLRNKMKNYEVIPPADAWEKIAAALDEGTAGYQFPDKLYNMEVMPPAAAWSAISASLPSADAAVVPMRKRTSSFLRYAAAAVFIGIAAFGIIKWTNSGNTESAGTAQVNPAAGSGTPGENNTPAEKIAGTQPTTGDSKQPLAPVAPGNRTRNSSGHAVPANYSYDEPVQNKLSNPVYAYEDHLPDMANRYIMLMTPDGNFIRMSKKWEDLVCCVSGEEQDEDCKMQLKKWQEKIATSSLATSSGNVLDILSLVNSLDENAEL